MATPINQIIVQDIVKKIYDSNIYLNSLRNVTEYTKYGKVTIPVFINDDSSISVNGSTASPASYNQTTESATVFNVDVIRINPTNIPAFEANTLTYDKIDLILGDKINKLVDVASNRVLTTLAGDVDGSRIISTSGSSGTGNAAGGGNKKMLTFKDLVNLQAQFNKDGMTEDGRFLVIDSVMYSEMLLDSQITKYLEFGPVGGSSVAQSGKATQVLGMSIIVKPSVASLNSTSGTANAWDATPATNDPRVAIAFHSSAPVYSLPEPVIFEQAGNPHSFGTVISAEQYMAVKNIRFAGDNKGVYLLKQG